MDPLVTTSSTKNVVYLIARQYVDDYRPCIHPDLWKVLDGYIRSRNLPGLANACDLFDPQSNGSNDLRHLSQVASFFKKNVVFSDPQVCEDAATLAFHKAEKRCRIANKRLDYYFHRRDRLDPTLERQISRAEGFITRVLGDFDRFLESLPHRIRVTPGATSTLSRRKSLPFMKVTMKPACTPGAVPYVKALYRYYGYRAPRCKTVLENRVAAVPKNWKTHRLIACEPTHNVPIQLAFDDYVKGRLRRNGINLSDQSLNQELSRIGSIDGTLCTVDLSAASDTLSLNAVHWLLPRPWAKFLTDVRTPRYVFRGETGTYSKFSSMGNGTTFGLESLVFAACCYALKPACFNVYGDDIVIDTDKYADLRRILSFFGFSINDAKSFFTGSFRESCGTDWYAGSNITPFYLRDWDVSKSSRPNLCHNVNGLASIALPGGDLWHWLLRLTTEHRLPLVPYNEASTSGVWIDISRAHKLKLFYYEHGLTTFRSYVSKTRKMKVYDSRTLFLWHLDKCRESNFPAYGVIQQLGNVVVRSVVPTLSNKYVLKRVNWILPVGGPSDDIPKRSIRAPDKGCYSGEPDHLFWWSDDLELAIR